MPEIDLQPLPPAEAIRFFEGKGFQTGFDWRDVWQQEHARAFTVAKAMRLDVLETIRQELDAAIKEGKTLRQFQAELRPRLHKLGWWGRKVETDPKTGERRVVQLGSPRRLKTIFDVNMRTAHSAGRWARAERVKEDRPFLMYSA
ncbi:MAG: head morphogenesis protein, partial [bacterium]